MFAFQANQITGPLDSQGLAVFGEKTENLGRFCPSKWFSIVCSIPSWEYFVKSSGSEVCLFSCFLLLVQNGLASTVMPDGMDDAGDKTGNPGNETEQSKNGTEHDSCIQQK